MFGSIIRVHKSGALHIGLYLPNCTSHLNDLNRHPGPDRDSKLKWNGAPYWMFGFTNLEQLRFWIYQDDWLKSLQKENFIVSQVYAPEEFIRKGRTQAIIDQREIIKHELIDWNIILEGQTD